MALSKKIKKAAYDKLTDEVKKLYVAGDTEGEYVLDLEGGEEDAGALRRALERERQQGGDNKKRIKELEDQLAEVSNADARKKGDIETLEKAWKKKLDDSETAHTGRISKLCEHIKKSLIDGTANTLAAKISTVPALMSKAIRERLQVNFDNDEPKLVVIGADGKPSEMTVEKLSEEFVANKEFSSIIIGSKASGGGAGSGSPRNTPSGGAGNPNEKLDFSKMPAKDLAAHLKAKKEANAT